MGENAATWVIHLTDARRRRRLFAGSSLMRSSWKIIGHTSPLVAGIVFRHAGEQADLETELINPPQLSCKDTKSRASPGDRDLYAGMKSFPHFLGNVTQSFCDNWQLIYCNGIPAFS